MIKGQKQSEDAKRRISETCEKKGIGKWMLGRRLNEETKEKLREKMLGQNNPFFGRTHTPESNMKNRLAHIGKRVSQETREKLRIINTGKKMSLEAIEKTRKANLREKNYNWLGEEAGYQAKHSWIRRNKEKTKNCQRCGSNRHIDFANISGKYKRDVNDFICLCRSCHKNYDLGKIDLKGCAYASS
jgi:hypothetical protein